ncbi:MAG TPA: S9 family peptidase, partial [Streptosporangiaceae bacterium]
MATQTHIYGEWPSPIDGADVARKQVGLAFPVIDAAGVWWQESRPEEGGRVAVVRQAPDGTGAKHDLLPMPWNARTRVHEYGGRSYLPLPDGFVFANFADQRLYRCGDAGAPTPPTPVALTPVPAEAAADRFADFVLSPGGDHVWCVRERHEAGGRIIRGIVAVPLDGSGVADPLAIRVLVSGSDFYACPAPSPDGTRLAWICWDH